MFPKDLFELSQEDVAASKMMYNGKVIRCLVTPHHSFKQLEELIPYSKNVMVFPEREMSAEALKGFISMCVANQTMQEINIVTTNVNILTDMVDSSVRILTEDENIVPCPCKTFMANIHTIKFEIFDNEAFRKSDAEKIKGTDKVNELIEAINQAKITGASQDVVDGFKVRNSVIGEDLIRNVLSGMIADIEII